MTIQPALSVGVNCSWDDASIIWAAQAGFKTIRVGWEPNWDFAQLQKIVATAVGRGLLVDLVCTPTKTNGIRRYDDPAMPGFVDKCARLTGLASIGFYNEGNHYPFINDPNPLLWADYQVKMKDIARHASPSIKILLEALSPEKDDLDPRKFLPAGINHNKRLLEFQAFGVHDYEFPYNPLEPNKWNPVAYMNELNNIWIWCGKPNMPFWVTEYGAPSALPKGETSPYPDAPYQYTEAAQLQWFLDYIQAFSKSQAKIAKVMWYCQHDGSGTTTGGDSWENYVGLLDVNNKEKPVAAAMKALAWGNR